MKNTQNKQKKFPNFLGDDFLLITSNLFLQIAEKGNAPDDEKGAFLEKIMPEFLEKTTAMILNELKEEQIALALKIVDSGMTYKDREIQLTKLIPSFPSLMSAAMDLFKRKIELGIYF